MALPASGQTVTGVYQYQVLLNADVGVLLGVTAANLVASDVPATFGTDTATGNPTVTINGVTQVMTAEGGSQSPNAFTYTSGGSTYIISNGPIAPTNVLDLSVLNLTALVGGLGDIGITPGATNYVACYLAGTMVLTDQGEIPVEDLKIGDYLITVSGAARPLKWIGTRSYSGDHVGDDISPICVKRGALADGVPHRDLYVSPRHALFIYSALFPAGLLVNETSIVKAANMDVISYFHLELESHDVILAEGAAAESFVDDNSRIMFQNAQDHRILYPAENIVPAEYCAPRIEDGFKLEGLVRHLASRGQLLKPDGTLERLGRLIGSLDIATPGEIAGWARNADLPAESVEITVLDNDVVIDEVVADQHRPDLQAAGFGNGAHGFKIVIPGRLSTLSRHVISVRRKADGAELPGSPFVVEMENHKIAA